MTLHKYYKYPQASIKKKILKSLKRRNKDVKDILQS